LKDHIIAFIYCDPEVCGATFDREEMKQKVYDDICRLANHNSFNKLEIPKQIHLLEEMFSIDNEMLTPTMKIRRSNAKKFLSDKIALMYEMPAMKASEKK